MAIKKVNWEYYPKEYRDWYRKQPEYQIRRLGKKIRYCFLLMGKDPRLREITAWLERFLRGFKKKCSGHECGQLVSNFWVDDVDFDVFFRFTQKVNSDEIAFGDVVFPPKSLLLVNISTAKPPDEPIKVVLTFKVHSGDWTDPPIIVLPTPRWPAWMRQYKVLDVPNWNQYEQVPMQELIDYLKAQ